MNGFARSRPMTGRAPFHDTLDRVAGGIGWVPSQWKGASAGAKAWEVWVGGG